MESAAHTNATIEPNALRHFIGLDGHVMMLLYYGHPDDLNRRLCSLLVRYSYIAHGRRGLSYGPCSHPTLKCAHLQHIRRPMGILLEEAVVIRGRHDEDARRIQHSRLMRRIGAGRSIEACLW
ncbi:hypothetical protein CY34DRAFT_154800 [Suillus luteus UH-Slu-Lm8-n1]|uniref:Uncharacterized protein n=1 Tax=Suillus luteus UH-Slu-Lm8-n1 TaxID=930992 RepID=A0A0C9ZT19_9AGAM|nr:hypothetical protein CY34DRAFT_154800 [Suillus luteus UH-Slu-Lm8-n1]